ncbi:hypothetical protein [Iodobacter fluviatilis]|uniref:Uncharacterized protein n=1 Tax=Iodobacter fluviatilis TaxID=537 RepID=A0A377SV84_9NEIS|nr:hypothetical protein [Iodobacter fluviatilis]TCU85086.1 hypothetical protein EV682_108113 [Iodobacter fluviatilis]STR45230.1 Uncharacterised protein [Iodobacter fluviatilis]
MSINLQLQLSIAPLSCFEAQRCLTHLAREGIVTLWQDQRPLSNDTCLLNLSAECASSESPEWLSERLAAAVWKETGRFVRLSCLVDSEAAEHLFTFEEPDYQRLMPAFRLRMPPLRR